MGHLSKIRYVLFALFGNMVLFVAYTHSSPLNAKSVFHCEKPAPSSITIITNAPPNRIICGSSKWNFSADYTEGDLYEWKISDPLMGSIVDGKYTPNIKVSFNSMQGRTKTVKVILAITKCKEVRRDTLTVRVKSIPIYEVTHDTIVCAGESLNFSISPTPINYSEITWNFGDGRTSNRLNPVHSYQNGDSLIQYKPVVNIVNPEGCLASVSSVGDLIRVKPAPVIFLSPTDSTTTCDPISRVLYATATTAMSAITDYKWYGPLDSNPPCCSICTSCTINKFGDYYVEVETSNGCKSVSNTLSIIESCDPNDCDDVILNSSRSSIAECGTVQINLDYRANGLEIVNEKWTFPPEAVNTIFTTGKMATATASFAKPGIYPFNYTVYADCSKTFNQTVYIPFIGDMHFEVECDSGTYYNVNLFDHSRVYPKEEEKIDHIYAYKKSGGNWKNIAAPLNAKRASVQLPAGNYELREIIYSNLTTAAPPCTTLAKLNLPSKPVANFEVVSAYKPACVKDVPVHFKNLSSPEFGLSYVWNFGDGSTNNQEHIYKVFGSELSGTVYWVTLTATDNLGCISTSGQYVEIQGNDLWDGRLKPELIQFPQPSQSNDEPTTLNYFSFIYGKPKIFKWYKGNKPILTEDGSASLEVSESGIYWVMGIDSFGCMVPSNPAEVNIGKEIK